MSYSSQGRGRGRGGGRGDYYKNKYGGGGRGRGRQQSREDFEEGGSHNNSAAGHISGGTFQELQALLKSIDGRQYPSYHDLETSPGGGWVNTDGLTRFTLEIGRAQSDPFAPPTQCRVSVPQSTALFPKNLVSNPIRRMASSDFLWRLVYRECQEMGANQTLKAGAVTWSGPKGGDVQIMEPTQHVLEQTAVWIKADGSVVGQLTVSLPARGRTILGAAAHQILNTVVTQLVSCCFVAVSVDLLAMQRHVDSVEDQVWLRDQLDGAGLVSFVRNGAILPRASGVDDRPMKVEESVLFLSPPSLEKQFSLPNAGCVATGMGIPRGITLICGGGFHGKSTLLDALQVAVYCKIPGDGREFCVTSPQAAKIRSEDGRCITAVDISSFIKNLPFGKSTTCFSTNDASGSTSQASNIVEAIELGADTLLIDEDTCATNFMIRDNKMMQLVACDKEPITPFVSVIQSLKQRGISTVLVVGGTGDFFDDADVVLVMDSYRCEDATTRARQIAQQSGPSSLPAATFTPGRERSPVQNEFYAGGKVKVLSQSVISYGDTELSLHALEQIVCAGQSRAISQSLQMLATTDEAEVNGSSLRHHLAAIERSIDQNEGLSVVDPGQFNGALVRPRLLEVGAAANRLRRPCFHQH